VIASQPHFFRDHSGSLVGSVLLHAVLLGAVLWAAAYVPKTTHVVPAIIEATLVSPKARQYVTPDPPAVAPEPSPAPTPPKPTPKVHTPPKAQPKPEPAPKVPTVALKKPAGQTEKAPPKAEPPAKAKPEPKPAKDKPALSKSVESEIDREIRDTEKAKAAEVLRAQQENQRRQADAARQAAAAEQQRANAAHQQQLAGATNQYVAEVKARVERSWTRPASAKKGVQCTLEVTQLPNGTVLQAQVIEPCNGDAALRASIRDAAYRASPLPVPKDADVFQRTLHLVFSPDD
jgi:colicin import membrane protein